MVSCRNGRPGKIWGGSLSGCFTVRGRGRLIDKNKPPVNSMGSEDRSSVDSCRDRQKFQAIALAEPCFCISRKNAPLSAMKGPLVSRNGVWRILGGCRTEARFCSARPVQGIEHGQTRSIMCEGCGRIRASTARPFLQKRRQAWRTYTCFSTTQIANMTRTYIPKTTHVLGAARMASLAEETPDIPSENV